MRLAAYPWFQRLDKLVHSGSVDIPNLGERRFTGTSVEDHANAVAELTGRFIHGIPVDMARASVAPKFDDVNMRAFVVAAYFKELLGNPQLISGVRIRHYSTHQVPTFWKRVRRTAGFDRKKAPLMGQREIAALSRNGFTVMSTKEFQRFNRAVITDHVEPALEQGRVLRPLLLSRNILSKEGIDRAQKLLELVDTIRLHETIYGTPVLKDNEMKDIDPILYKSALVIRSMDLLQSLREAAKDESVATSDYAYNIACHAYNHYRRLFRASGFYDLHRRMSDAASRIFFKRENLLRSLPKRVVKYDYDDVAGLYRKPEVKRYLDDTRKLMRGLTDQTLLRMGLSRIEESAETFQEIKDPWSVIEKYYSVWTRHKKRGKLEAPLGDKLTNPLLVHDLVRTRVILDNVDDCYAFAKGKLDANVAKKSGIDEILDEWVKSGRITSFKVHQYRDYIASPKDNGYSALHVIVDVEVPGKNGNLWLFNRRRRMEFQVLTKEMWENNEKGTAHHELEKEPKKGGVVEGAYAGTVPKFKNVNLADIDLANIGEHFKTAAGEGTDVGIRPWEDSLVVKINDSNPPYRLTGDDTFAYALAMHLPRYASELKKHRRDIVLLDQETNRPIPLDSTPSRDNTYVKVKLISPGSEDEKRFAGYIRSPKEIMQLVPEHRQDELDKVRRTLGKLLK
jgi:hypothetical protein